MGWCFFWFTDIYILHFFDFKVWYSLVPLFGFKSNSYRLRSSCRLRRPRRWRWIRLLPWLSGTERWLRRTHGLRGNGCISMAPLADFDIWLEKADNVSFQKNAASWNHQKIVSENVGTQIMFLSGRSVNWWSWVLRSTHMIPHVFPFKPGVSPKREPQNNFTSKLSNIPWDSWSNYPISRYTKNIQKPIDEKKTIYCLFDRTFWTLKLGPRPTRPSSRWCMHSLTCPGCRQVHKPTTTAEGTCICP